MKLELNQLPGLPGAALADGDLVIVARGGVLYKTTAKEIADLASAGPGSVDWGDVGGTLSDQTDLQGALDALNATDGDLQDAIDALAPAALNVTGRHISQPTTGQTVTIGAGVTFEILLINDADIATLLVKLPLTTGIANGHRVKIGALLNGITTMTLQTADASGISIFGNNWEGGAAFAANSHAEWEFVADVAGWVRVG